MKSKVIEALHSTALSQKERFEGLFDLYRKHPEALQTFNRSFNAQGYSPINLQSLEYELKKVYKIKDTEVAEFIPVTEMKVVNADKGLSAELSAQLVNLDIDNANYRDEILPLAIDVSNALEIELTSKKGDDLKAFLKAHKPVVVNPKNPFEDAPEAVKESIKLRDEFPFLKETDTPDKYKILVADKFTAYENFKAGREEIQKLLAEGKTEDDLFDLAKKTVENFELNLDIYDELNYYKEHKQILGKHPIFKDEMMQQRVEAYSTKELLKTQKNLRTYISRESKVLDGMDAGEQKEALSIKVTDWKAEQELVDKRVSETK